MKLKIVDDYWKRTTINVLKIFVIDFKCAF